VAALRGEAAVERAGGRAVSSRSRRAAVRQRRNRNPPKKKPIKLTRRQKKKPETPLGGFARNARDRGGRGGGWART
jgi:hypothetical protein